MATDWDSPGSLNVRVQEYLAHRDARGIAFGTRRNDAITLRRFIQVTGNILLKNVTDKHVIDYLAQAKKTRPKSLAIDIACLRSFFKWARVTSRYPRDFDPMVGIDSPKPDKTEKFRVPVGRFPELLDAAVHPRDRVAVALGLHLFLRASEMMDIKLGDLDLDAGQVLIRVRKKKRLFEDVMPISPQLDQELRAWLTWYTVTLAGRPDNGMYLVPAKAAVRYARDPASGLFTTERIAGDRLRPDRPVANAEWIAKRALLGIGYDEQKLKGQGIHALRRSGARAWFDHMQQMEPYEDEETGEWVKPPAYPIRPVMTALHHENQTTTEGYIGLEPDKLERDKLMKRIMFVYNRDNVVKLEVANGSRREEGRRV